MTHKWIGSLIFTLSICTGVAFSQQPQAVNPWGQQPYQTGTGQAYQAPSVSAAAGAQTPAVSTQAGAVASQPMTTGSMPATTAGGTAASGSASGQQQQPAYKPMPVFNPYQQNTKRASGGAAVYGQYTPTAPVSRPFENYKAPSPISPYMQMYRTDNRSGIDNYNLYVKPALEAEKQQAETQAQLDALQQQQQQINQQQVQQAQQATAQAVGGAVYGNINSGKGASYGTGAQPTLAPATTAENPASSESEKEDQANPQATQPNYNTLNPYIPTGAKPSQYMVQP